MKYIFSLFFNLSFAGVKPYTCPTCGLGFVEKCNLRRHEEMKHSNKTGTKPSASALIASIKKSKKKRGGRKRKANNTNN
jgi:hypothetical protein